MRTLALIFLWLGVAGFGLMTLCSGVFVPMAPEIAVPVGLVVALLTWACWRGTRLLQAPSPPPPGPSAEPPASPPLP